MLKPLISNTEIFYFKGENVKFRKNQIFESNSAPNHFSVRKFYKKILDLKRKKSFFVIFEFLILRGKIAKFQKIRISRETEKVCFAFLDHLLLKFLIAARILFIY